MRIPGSISGLATTKNDMLWFLTSSSWNIQEPRKGKACISGPPGGQHSMWKLDHRAEVPKFGCSKLGTATKGAGKARIRTRPGANFIVRCGDSEYEGPGDDLGRRDKESRHFGFWFFSLIARRISSEGKFKNPGRSEREFWDLRASNTAPNY